MLQIIPCATHEKVVRVLRPEVGLHAIIAIHSTAFGPAAGGLRFYPYASEAAALEDALRLSRGMTYKNVAADLPLGGGKAVVIGDPAKDKTPELLRAFGEAVEALGGAYWTAEDMGVDTADMEIVAERTSYVAGLPRGEFASGDPSPVTARGVFNALRIAVERSFGSADLSGRRVAVQGLGHVGWRLAEMLRKAGAALTVADVDPARVAAAEAGLGAASLPPEAIHTAEADVFAPCAIGAILNDETIPALRARVVCGAANNQLAEPRHDAMLHARGVLYTPDYVANAGGIINAAAEINRIRDRASWVEEKLGALSRTLIAVFDEAEARGEPPGAVADRMVEARLDARAGVSAA